MKISKLFSLMAIASMMSITSCSSDEPIVNPTGDEATVSFTVDVPASIASRQKTDFADGTTATRLAYAVYKYDSDAQEYQFVTSKTGLDVIDLKANVTLNLLTGEQYAVAFWAAAKDAPYTFSPETNTLEVNYSDAASNDEKRDAFYYCKEMTVSANATYNITLTRPFAQLNIGTSDLSAAASDAKFTAYTSQVKVKAYNSFNLITGEVNKDDFEEHTFTFSRLPQGETFPVDADTYDYLAMNYLLMPVEDQELVDVELQVKDYGETSTLTRSYNQIPLKRNYRTNIYGELLTATNVFNVVIEPNPIGNNSFTPWDGGVEAITPDAEGNYVVENAAQLAWLATQDPATFSGKTIKLAADINLSGSTSTWTSINLYDGAEARGARRYDSASKTIFDGQGHTVYNLTAPLILAMNGDIKNLTVSSAKIKSNSSCQGAVVGTLYGNLSDVHVADVTIEGDGSTNSVNYGGIVGLFHGESLTNCSAADVKISGVDDAAGALVGKTDSETVALSGCLVEGSSVEVATESNASGLMVGDAGEGNVAMSDCSYDDNCYPKEWAGGSAAVTMDGLSPMEKYPTLFADDSNIYIYGVSGLSGFHDYLYANCMANNLAKYKYVIADDIDCSSYTWESIWISLGSNYAAGFVIDGGNHTISNLTVTGSGLFGGYTGGHLGDAAITTVKDITFDNANITGGWHVGLFGQLASSFNLENVNVINSKVTGTCNVAALLGSTGEFAVAPTVAFKNCSVKNCVLTATGTLAGGADPTGASIFAGRLLGDTHVTFSGCSQSGNKCVNNDLVGGGIYGHADYSGGWVDVFVVNDYTDR